MALDGVVEGACKNLVKDRMEQWMMRWTIAGTEAVLRMRSIQINGNDQRLLEVPYLTRTAETLREFLERMERWNWQLDPSKPVGYTPPWRSNRYQKYSKPRWHWDNAC
ncbi:MAG TPA: hypothetical protein VLE95_06790 [Chlamydiales bacterium]|nr:hypothetical protein [Chlamydiales bacterium]